MRTPHRDCMLNSVISGWPAFCWGICPRILSTFVYQFLCWSDEAICKQIMNSSDQIKECYCSIFRDSNWFQGLPNGLFLTRPTRTILAGCPIKSLLSSSSSSYVASVLRFLVHCVCTPICELFHTNKMGWYPSRWVRRHVEISHRFRTHKDAKNDVNSRAIVIFLTSSRRLKVKCTNWIHFYEFRMHKAHSHTHDWCWC